MDPNRKGEIAYALLKHKFSKEDVRLGNRNEFKRELGNVAKAIGVEEAELAELIELIVRELVDETFQSRVRVLK